MGLPQAVADVLLKAECQDLFTKEGTRVKCMLNDHCIPFNSIGVLERFLGGKKFKKLASQHRGSQLLQKFEPFLIPSQRLPGHLFCALTGQMIKASVDAARKHMKGQRFIKGKERFMEDDMELLEEPVDDAAKPTRRANHRLSRASDSATELGSGGLGAAEDTSEAMDGSSDRDGHGPMEELLASDDSGASDAGGHGGSSDGGTEEAGEADGGTGSTGKRKRGQKDGQGGGVEGGRQKHKKLVVAPGLAGLQVTVAAGQGGWKKQGKVLHEGVGEGQSGALGRRSGKARHGRDPPDEVVKKTGKSDGKGKGKKAGNGTGVQAGGGKGKVVLRTKQAAADQGDAVKRSKTRRVNGHAK